MIGDRDLRCGSVISFCWDLRSSLGDIGPVGSGRESLEVGCLGLGIPVGSCVGYRYIAVVFGRFGWGRLSVGFPEVVPFLRSGLRPRD